MSRATHGLLVAAFLAGSCGRINYDPLSLADAGPGSQIDADQNAVDAGSASAPTTGSYTGDGTNERIISVGLQPALVILQSDAGRETIVRMSSMPNDRSKSLVGSQPILSGLISHAAGGFEVGSDPRVNEVGISYHWLALPASSTLAGGQYLGNGTGQAITGLGFAPEWILFADEDDGSAVVRMPQPAALTFRLDDGTGVPDGVASLDADGFTLGSRPFVNRSNRSFHYVAWRSSPEHAAGNYTGDNNAGRVISGLGFAPSYVMVHTPGLPVTHRFASLPATTSLSIPPRMPILDAITTFLADGFSLGSGPGGNELGAEYTFTAFSAQP